jgi:hypothetical protein
MEDHMDRTFATEDDRKTKLFEAWNEHLSATHPKLRTMNFQEIFEGMVTVLGRSKDCLSLQLMDGRKLRKVQITPEISAQSEILDTMFVVLGRRERKWFFLHVLSVGSIIDMTTGKAHLTVNPLLVAGRSERAERMH